MIAGDNTANITVKNSWRWEIHHLFLSPVSSNNWGPDHLGPGALRSDETFQLSGVSCDTYDVKIVDGLVKTVDDDDVDCILKGVPICGAHETWEITNESLLQCQFAGPSSSGATSGDSKVWKQQVTRQTRIRSGPDGGNLASKGYTLREVAKTGLRDKETAETLSLILSPLGRDYILMGVCDDNCTDLDLAVIKNGEEFKTDTTDTDWPMVEVYPTGNHYQLKVGMYGCTVPTCGYQVTVWVK